MALCLAAQIGRYAHAKQFKRMRPAVRTLRTRVGRVLPEAAKAKVQDLLQRTGRILAQRTKDKKSCTPCTHPRWNASAKARPGQRTSSA